MSAPTQLNLIIDGKKCTATAGQTILDIANANVTNASCIRERGG